MGFEVPYRNSRFIGEMPSVQGCTRRFSYAMGALNAPPKGERGSVETFPSTQAKRANAQG